MKRILFIIIAILACTSIAAWAGKPELKFHDDGTFKILQITDLHLKYQEPKSDVAWENLRKVTAVEQPDLIMLTGDLIYSKPGNVIFSQLLDSLESLGRPYAIVFGNHDRQLGYSNDQLLEMAMKRPHCIASDVPKLYGAGTYTLMVKSHDGQRNASVIYCFDSGENIKLEGMKGYDYIHHDQVEWYARTSRELTKANGGTPLPAIAFFHIPVPEYAYATRDDDVQQYGTRREKICCPPINSGLFAQFKEMGDVMGTFCGHDHDNDFALCYQNIMLCYGRFGGGNTEYNHLKPNGARVIQLTEDQRTITTWIRLRTGEKQQVVTYPDSFKK